VSLPDRAIRSHHWAPRTVKYNTVSSPCFSLCPCSSDCFTVRLILWQLKRQVLTFLWENQTRPSGKGGLTLSLRSCMARAAASTLRRWCTLLSRSMRHKQGGETHSLPALQFSVPCVLPFPCSASLYVIVCHYVAARKTRGAECQGQGVLTSQ